MKKLSTLLMLLFFLALPALAQMGQYRDQLSSEDQKRFDSYYQRWLDYKRTNNRDQVISMEERMQDVMRNTTFRPACPIFHGRRPRARPAQEAGRHLFLSGENAQRHGHGG